MQEIFGEITPVHVKRKVTAMAGLGNDRHIRGYSERTCPPMPPEDGRFDPTSCTSFDAS
jgi:hypothetical protein